MQSQLLNAEKFWTAFPIPSVACDNPSFEPVFKSTRLPNDDRFLFAYTVDDRNLMWRGPSWGMTNWIVNQGLMKHEYNVESGMPHWLMAFSVRAHSL